LGISNNFPIFDLAQPTETRGDILVHIPYWHAALCGTRITIYNHGLVSNSITVAEKKSLGDQFQDCELCTMLSLYVFSSNENDANVEHTHTHSIDSAQM
jgi:predicted amino acid racemase